MKIINVTIGPVDADGNPVIDTKDYSKQDAMIATLESKGVLSVQTWKYMAADYWEQLTDAEAEIAALKEELNQLRGE